MTKKAIMIVLGLMAVLCRALVHQQQPSGRLMTIQRAASEEMDPSSVVIMMNGLPGSMGREVAAACQRRGIELAEVALTGTEFAGQKTAVGDRTVSLVVGDEAEAAVAKLVASCKEEGKILIAIDYTIPKACLPNAQLYARHGISFVMGTTGGDRAAIDATVASGTHSAVIAPNMAKQIVALQAAINNAATEFPGAFAGYSLNVIESHQSTKKDTSGTAKAIVSSMITLVEDSTPDAADNAINAIERVRDSDTQLDGAQGRLQKVPSEFINGHAYHTYSLTSPGGDVRFELRHNVNGRNVYAEGTADAVLFLARRLRSADTRKRLFDMIDVLKSGELF